MTNEEYLKLFVSRDVISFIAEDDDVDVKTAMEKFYTSKVFDKLQDSETGLYRESGSYVYELYKDDLL
jgi:hypothetical protein